MKSNYTRSKTEVEREARKAAKAEIDKVYDEWAQSCCYHALAVCFAILHREFGFGAERLKRLRRSIDAELSLMEHGVLGRKYAESDIRKWLLSIGIDFEDDKGGGKECPK